jgi:hypothetical protein
MTHPITALQGTLVAALKGDGALAALVGDAIFDAPPEGQGLPYIAIVRHDIAPRDADIAPGHEHRLLIHIRVAEASRRAVVEIAELVLGTALTAGLSSAELTVTHRRHERTETAIDAKTGQGRAAVSLRIFSEPTS